MTSLQMWLYKATRCLSADSVAQVQREIQEHYESAREAAIASGTAVEEADRMAVTSLGDPRQANRQYRKVLLTTTEARMLRDIKWEGRAVCGRPYLVSLLRAIPVAALGGTALALLSGHLLLSRVLLVLGAGSAVLLAAPTFPLYTPARARIFRWVKWVPVIAATAVAFGPGAADWIGAIAIAFSGIAWTEWTRHSIRRKLPVEQWPRALFL